MKHAALTWVKVTIDESLKQTRQALEQFVENPNETAPLQQCVLLLHEIRGVLSILELQTAALLVQDIEVTIRTLLAGKIAGDTQTYDILMRALLQLPNYLDHLAIVQQDMPVALLPLLNELRALRKQPALVASSFFTPDLNTVIPVAAAPKLADDKFKDYVNKMRAAFQKSLVALLKNPKDGESWKMLYTVMQRLQQATGTAPLTKLWWISEGLLESILQRGLEPSTAILNAFKQLDGILKSLAEHGNAALRLAPSKPLLNNLLYFAAHARSTGKQILAVKEVFKLSAYLPTEAELQAARMILTGPDIELMKTVITLLKDDFTRVEETLDIFNRAENPSVSELTPLVEMLSNMGNTLGLLGLMVQRNSLLQQAKLIKDIVEERSPPEQQAFLDIANNLLKVSTALEILGVQGVHARQLLQQSLNTAYSATPQFKLVLSVAVSEAKTELSQVIQPIVSFLDNPAQQDESLMAVPERLKQIGGFLNIASEDRAAKLLHHCNRYIEHTFIKNRRVPPENQQKALADALISLEMFLDTLAGNPMDAKGILDITAKCAAQLQ